MVWKKASFESTWELVRNLENSGATPPLHFNKSLGVPFKYCNFRSVAVKKVRVLIVSFGVKREN